MGTSWSRMQPPRTTLMLLLSIVFLLGLAAARRLPRLSIWWLLPLLVVTLIAWRHLGKRCWLVSGIILAFGLGWWRGSTVMSQLQPYRALQHQNVTLTGTAASDGVYADHSQLSFTVNQLRISKPVPRSLVGNTTVSGYGAPMIYRGDRVQVTGKLYPSRGVSQARISFGQLQLLHRHHGWLDSLRLRFLAGMQSALPEPLASFGLGLLIGQRNTLPINITTALAVVGLTHIVAVSGYNLTILMRAVRRYAGHRSKYQTAVLSLLLMTLFLVFTGFSASIIRATLVCTLSLGAWYYGRTIKPLLLICLVAAMTAGWNPLYLWSDLGWWLSFLAFFGVLILAPLVTRRLHLHLPSSAGHVVHPLKALVIESLAAELMTLPLMLMMFGRFSFVALLANILVVPLVPLAMLLALVAGMSGLVAPAMASWLAWPARLLLTYMLDIANGLSRLPHAVAQAPLSIWQLVVSYAAVALVCVLLWRKTRATRIITDVNSTEMSEVS